MCRSITVLRGLEPPATSSEIEDAARQFVRKVGALTTPAQLARPEVQRAIELITSATQELLVELPARRVVAPGPAQRRRPPTSPDNGEHEGRAKS